MRTQIDTVVPAQVAEPETNQTRRKKFRVSGSEFRVGTRNAQRGTRNSKRGTAHDSEALSRAANGMSLANYPNIYAGFMAKGIPEAEIKPRENVFTFNAWRALGRIVRKGEHGVKVATVIVTGQKEQVDPESGEVKTDVRTRPWTSTVFHISQTEPIAGNAECGVRSAEPKVRTNIVPVSFQNAPPSINAPPSTLNPPPATGWRARFHRLA